MFRFGKIQLCFGGAKTGNMAAKSAGIIKISYNSNIRLKTVYKRGGKVV